MAETTLIEELEQAADEACEVAVSHCKCKFCDRRQALAASLRARVEHLKAVEAQHADVVGKSYDEGWQDALDVAGGPIPPSDETGGPK